ncbi:hypothetical protein L3X38_029624 [Prunus dulcis]|uniref:Uncharacterized protein n=1 Tax=Prunus dulcis TaxID=3755 RepID=A0AAD4VUH3_PRUDU|nr:hypothetical protein L3X38_029624 [Prunus dulcis]
MESQEKVGLGRPINKLGRSALGLLYQPSYQEKKTHTRTQIFPYQSLRWGEGVTGKSRAKEAAARSEKESKTSYIQRFSWKDWWVFHESPQFVLI